MGDKILFNVLLPATATSYELWVPLDITVAQATQLICRILGMAREALFKPQTSTMLFDRASGKALKPDIYIGDLGYCNGSRLILV
jgi:hypothetical protein